MRGRFNATKVMKALDEAGVTNYVSGAEVLIVSELKHGNIKRIARGIYEQKT